MTGNEQKFHVLSFIVEHISWAYDAANKFRKILTTRPKITPVSFSKREMGRREGGKEGETEREGGREGSKKKERGKEGKRYYFLSLIARKYYSSTLTLSW